MKRNISFSVGSEGRAWNVKHERLLPPSQYPFNSFVLPKVESNYTLSPPSPLVFSIFYLFFDFSLFLYCYFTYFSSLLTMLHSLKRKERHPGRTTSTLSWSLSLPYSVSLCLFSGVEYIIYYSLCY